jgi:hypothetical protein
VPLQRDLHSPASDTSRKTRLHPADSVGVCIWAVGAVVSCLPQRKTKTEIWVHAFGAGKGDKVLFVSHITVVFSGNKSVSDL